MQNQRTPPVGDGKPPENAEDGSQRVGAADGAALGVAPQETGGPTFIIRPAAPRDVPILVSLTTGAFHCFPLSFLILQ
jgi:hypothetical protein